MNFLAQQGIEVVVSSTQVVGAVGALIGLLLALIGSLLSKKLEHIDERLGKIEAQTATLGTLENRLVAVERTIVEMRASAHALRNFVNGDVGSRLTELETWRKAEDLYRKRGES
jgi:hypothetical protein